MALTRISIDTPDLAATDRGFLTELANSNLGLERLAEFIRSIAGGVRTGKVRLNTGAVQAEGEVSFDSFAADDTVTVNGVVFTGKASPSGTQQFAVGASDEACANNFYEKLLASALDKIVGVIVVFRRGTVQLSSFVNTNTITINGVIFTGKTTPDAADPRQFKIGSTDAKSAQALLDAINICKTVYPTQLSKVLSVTRSTATLTMDYAGSLTLAASANATLDNDMVRIRSAVGGQIGNLCTLAISARGAVSGANLTGGTEGTETIFAQSRSIL